MRIEVNCETGEVTYHEEEIPEVVQEEAILTEENQQIEEQ